MDWITKYDYSLMIEKYLDETEVNDISASDYVYVVRGSAEIVFDKFTKEPVIYSPIIKYYLFLNNIAPGEKYERMKSYQLINEMVNVNSFI